MCVLVLEASTSSAKAMVYNENKGIEKLEVIPFDKKTGNVSLQNTNEVYSNLLHAGKRAARGYDIQAIALGGIWHSLILCDSFMNPVTKTYTWAYMGASGYASSLRTDTEFVNRVYHSTGCMVHAMYPVYILSNLRENGLSIKDLKIAGQGSYNFYRLTGEFLSSYSMESGSGMLNIHTLNYSEEMLEFAGIKDTQLPKLCSHFETRPLLKEPAEVLGIASGIPVLPAFSDGALNQIGSGALKQGYMTLSVGTSGAIRMAVDTPLLPEQPSTWCYYTAGKYLCGAATSGAANCVDWYKQNILGGNTRHSEMEALIQDTKEAPVFLPFLFGERCPGWRDDKKGGFYGVNGNTGRGGLYYAILEGVLFNLYQCYLKLVELAGVPEKIFVSGGICHSQLWLLMLTDIFQKEIILQDSEQASLLGGAVLALHAIGKISDIEAFTVKSQRQLFPNNDNQSFYKGRFSKYMDFYNSL